MLPRAVFAGLVLSASVACGQSVFVTVDKGAAKIIKHVEARVPMVEAGGKLVAASGGQLGLVRANVYRSGFVALEEDFAVGVWHVENNSGDRYAFELRVTGHLTSDTAFPRCFAVLELVSATEKTVAFAEIPPLNAGERRELNLVFPLRAEAQEGPYRLHLFSDGIELLHGRMRPEYIAAQRQRTADMLARQVQDFPPLLAFRVAPVYPEALKKSSVTGSARMRCHVTKDGAVSKVELLSATAPAFGEAALVAARKWQFDPAMKNRQFVESDTEITVEFDPRKM